MVEMPYSISAYHLCLLSFRDCIKNPFEKMQLCTSSTASPSLGVRHHAFGRFPFNCHTYPLFL